MTALAVWALAIAASVLATHATARLASHEHVVGEHYNKRCCICGGSIQPIEGETP